MTPANNLSALESAFDEMVQQQVIEPGIRMMRIQASTAFEFIQESTKIWSGYAAANIRIGIGGLDDAELNPAARGGSPYPDPGQYEHLIDPARLQEIGKLSDLKFGEPVEVGTAVPYYIEIEWSEHRGADIFAEASIVAPEIAQGVFNQS